MALTSCPSFFISGFTDVISQSKVDHYLSRCALDSDLRTRDLIEALERINRFDAATVIGQWLSSVDKSQHNLTKYNTRGESSASERSCSFSSRTRGASGPSEHSDVWSSRMGTSSDPEGSPLLVTGHAHSSSHGRGPCSRTSSLHSFDTDTRKESGPSEHSLPFEGINGVHSRGASDASHGSFPGGVSQHWNVDVRHRCRSTSSTSSYSHPTEESYAGSVERLSCEESQMAPTEQIVPQPRLLIHPCSSCEYCGPKLPVEETGDKKVRVSVEETSKDTHAQRRDADLSVISSPVQVSKSDIKEDVSPQSTEEMFPTMETGGTDDRTSLPVSSLIPELSSRLSLSWKPVALDLGFKSSEFGCFEQASLLRVQASHMLHSWFSKNTCTFECEHCQRVIWERLEDAFENAHRSDLKDFVHSREV